MPTRRTSYKDNPKNVGLRVVFILLLDQPLNWKQLDSSSRNLTPMASMEDFRCDTFEMRIRFVRESLNTDRLLGALAENEVVAETDEDGDTEVFAVLGASEGSAASYHAHLSVDISQEGAGTVELFFYPGSRHRTTSSLNAETCAQWLAEFFEHETIATHLHVNYTFDNSVKPIIALPFPILASEPLLAGATVSGVALTLPNDTLGAIIQRTSDQTFLFLRETAQINLREFDLIGELKRLTDSVRLFVKEN